MLVGLPVVLKRAFVKLIWNDVRSFASVYLNENVSGINEMIWQKLGGIGDLFFLLAHRGTSSLQTLIFSPA